MAFLTKENGLRLLRCLWKYKLLVCVGLFNVLLVLKIYSVNEELTHDRNTTSLPEIPVTLFSPYLINNPSICTNASNSLTHIIIVHSAIDHYRKRRYIRKTWANTTIFPSGRVVFILGTTIDGKIPRSVLQEFQQYRDIVVGDFRDTYRNLTLKGVLGLRWVTEACPRANIVLKVDDDIVFNTFLFLKQYKNQFNTANSRHNIMIGHIRSTSPIQRNKKDRWYVDDNGYWFKGETIYPVYPNGLCVGLNMHLVKILHKNAFKTPFFWIDDVYMFGLLTRTAEVTRIDILDAMTYDLNTQTKCYAEDPHCRLLVGLTNGQNDERKETLWKMMVEQNRKSEPSFNNGSLEKSNVHHSVAPFV